MELRDKRKSSGVNELIYLNRDKRKSSGVNELIYLNRIQSTLDKWNPG